MIRKMFAGLPELGISNGDDLKETLTNCAEPLKAIDQFQVTTGFNVVFFFKKKKCYLVDYILAFFQPWYAYTFN